MTRVRLLVAVLGAVMLAACAQLPGCSGPPPAEEIPRGDAGSMDLQALPDSRKHVIAFLGDSITAGQGLTMTQAYPALIGGMFAVDGYHDIEILNAGVSGDTTAGGLQRLEQVLAPNVKVLVVALGANDALRGLPIARTRENLAGIIDRAFEAGAEVLLVGMEAPTNYGEDYRDAFRDMFSQLAAQYGRRLGFVPFLLEGVAGMPQLNQADGIHPNAEGAKIIAGLIYPSLRNMIDLLPVADTGQ